MSSIHIARHGQSLGSYSEEEVKEGISSKRFMKDDLVWRIGMSDWSPLHEVADAWGFDLSLFGEVTPHEKIPPDYVEPAWERRDELGFIKALYHTVKMVLLAPNHTFSRLRITGGFLNPLFYYLIITSFSISIRILLEIPLILKNPLLLGPQLSSLSQSNIIIGALVLIVISPLFFIIGIFFSAAVTHLSLKIVKGAHEPFEATFRTFCYALGSVAVFQFLPLLGGIIAAFWGVLSYFIGLKKVHAISAWKTFFAILVSTMISFVIFMLVAAVYIVTFGVKV
ncbi:MAG: YIP1 family protein [Chthoniobacterales bacterium]|nr:YIP1 family protein [Chthoniobacterales bacterium]